jgi:putative addiction module component (TIGR02574 family)
MIKSMAHSLPNPPPGFDSLSVDEQIEYVQSLWDRIAASPDRVPVPDWHWQLIEERLAEHEANPNDVVSWEEVRSAMEAKYGKRR